MVVHECDRKGLDKFYTNERASTTFLSFLQRSLNLDSFENIVEPSAGAGALLKLLPKRAVGVDIAPEFEGIIKSDFFDYTYPEGSTITVGNPPFGNRSSLAIEFFKHAAKSSDAIAFIIPVTWEKFSIQKRLPEGWALIASERLPEDSFEFGGKPYKVRCCMQVWVRSTGSVSDRVRSQRIEQAPPISHNDFYFTTKDSADFFVIGAAVHNIINVEDVKPNNRGYYIKSNIDVETLKHRLRSIKWSDYGSGVAGGGVTWYNKGDIIDIYARIYEDKIKEMP
ncbi:MAG: hypothetical protein ACRC6V_08680 [Bacteroidales bacterium]